MQRIMVIGCPGSGKSTFSKKLHEKLNISLYHMDMLNWNSDRTTVSKPVLQERLNRILSEDAWIIDGNYGATMEMRIKACNTVFFLDYPLDVCLDGIRSRRGKPRSDMPWIEYEEDEEFTEFIKNFGSTNRPEILRLLETYSHKDIHTFTSRSEANGYLAQLSL